VVTSGSTGDLPLHSAYTYESHTRPGCKIPVPVFYDEVEDQAQGKIANLFFPALLKNNF
jgi:hypothetical protein